jgi:hypothetical protein
MPAFRKQKSRLHLELTAADQATAHGGQVLVDALCRRFDLWHQLDRLPGLDPRKRTGSGFFPSALIAQLLFNFTSGGVSLADAQRLGQDRVLLGLLGLARTADETTLGEWLRAQTPASVRQVQTLNARFVDWVWAQAPRNRLLHAGWAEYFFDDTQIEVTGKQFEGARRNYEGNQALSWQVLWKGPFVLDQQLDGAGDVSEHLPIFLGEHAARWQGEQSYLYVDSASSGAKFVNAIDQAGFTAWSISYNKWTDKLERLAGELPASQWTAESVAAGAVPTEHYAWVQHQPGECARTHRFATVRRREEGDLLDRYAFVLCQAAETQTPAAVLERHRLKGAKEQGFSQLLSDLDLHHPPCQELVANQMFYAIATLAFNLLMALRVLEMPDDAQGWRVRTIIRQVLTLPVSVSRHARYERAWICIPAGWRRWWQLYVQRWLPRRRPGRPAREEVDGGPPAASG